MRSREIQQYDYVFAHRAIYGHESARRLRLTRSGGKHKCSRCAEFCRNSVRYRHRQSDRGRIISTPGLVMRQCFRIFSCSYHSDHFPFRQADQCGWNYLYSASYLQLGCRFNPYDRSGIAPEQRHRDAAYLYLLERRRVTDPYDNSIFGNSNLYGLIHHSIPVDDIRESCRRKRDP